MVTENIMDKRYKEITLQDKTLADNMVVNRLTDKIV